MFLKLTHLLDEGVSVAINMDQVRMMKRATTRDGTVGTALFVVLDRVERIPVAESIDTIVGMMDMMPAARYNTAVTRLAAAAVADALGGGSADESSDMPREPERDRTRCDE